MDMVDSRDDGGGGRDDSRRYFPTYFSLSFDFSPFSFLLLLLLLLLLLFFILEE